MKNTKVAEQLNDLMSKRNNVEIYCNGNDDLVIRGTMNGVKKSVYELLRSGLQVINPIVAPDNTNLS